ncbi:unnamed protein product, partial [Didymodactylos carnosus]
STPLTKQSCIRHIQLSKCQFYLKDKFSNNLDLCQFEIHAQKQLTENITLITSAKVKIYIDDINNNKPRFSKDIYKIYVMKKKLLDNDDLLLLRVFSIDHDTGLNGYVQYQIEQNPFIEINETNGWISIKKNRVKDRSMIEHKNYLLLKLYAQDSGLPSLNTTGLLNITFDNYDNNHVNKSSLAFCSNRQIVNISDQSLPGKFSIVDEFHEARTILYMTFVVRFRIK